LAAIQGDREIHIETRREKKEKEEQYLYKSHNIPRSLKNLREKERSRFGRLISASA
jgi:hypothetical protein